MISPWRPIAVCAPAISDTVGNRWRRLAIAGCLSLWGVVGIATSVPSGPTLQVITAWIPSSAVSIAIQ